jgi:hypothetical protein
MRGSTPTLHCDAEDGFCGSWDVDYYEATTSTVGGVRITEDRRAPGWVNTPESDLCPQHAEGGHR